MLNCLWHTESSHLSSKLSPYITVNPKVVFRKPQIRIVGNCGTDLERKSPENRCGQEPGSIPGALDLKNVKICRNS
jgi:hypothetical protein